MNDLFVILASLSGLFFALLLIKSIFQKKFCVLCGSIFMTWLVLLFLYWNDQYQNKVLLALLMGESITGIYYFVENRLSKRFHIFRLPFMLTLITLFYGLLQGWSELNYPIIFIAIIWAIFILIYLFRASPSLRSIAHKLIECCKNW